MNLSEKLKFMRLFKGLSQEEVAEQLGLSTVGYGKIERGETDVSWSRLQQIAQAMEIELEQLLGLTENNVFNFIGNSKDFNIHSLVQNYLTEMNPHGAIYLTESQCTHELEKCRLLIQQHEKENTLLRKQIAQLEDIIQLLRGEKAVIEHQG